MYKTIVPRSVKLTEAPGFGKPIVLYDKNSNGAIAYCNLTQEVIGNNTQPNEIKEDTAKAEIDMRENAEVVTEMEGQDGEKVG